MADTCKTCGGCTDSRHETCGRDKPNKGKCACAAPADIDWSRWLPPSGTPETGDKELKPGQIWAERWKDFASVLKVGAQLSSGAFEFEVLAKLSVMFEQSQGWHGKSPVARRAVLVQDIGQPEPTPPDVLYGQQYDTEQRPIRANHVALMPDGRLEVAYTKPEATAPAANDTRVCWWCAKRDDRNNVGHCSREKQFHSRCWDLWQSAGYPERPLPAGHVLLAGDFHPGDVLSTTYGNFKLIAFEGRGPVAGLMQETWSATPTDDSWRTPGNNGAPPDHICFTRREVCGVVRGWRAGQRRRVLATARHSMFEGAVSTPTFADLPSECMPAGYWLVRDDGNVQRWASEEEPSELLEEAPAANGQCPCYDNSGFRTHPRCLLTVGHEGDHCGHELELPQSTSAPRQTATMRRPLDPEKVARARAAIDKLTARTLAPKAEVSEAETTAVTKLLQDAYDGKQAPVDGVKCAKCGAPRNVRANGAGGTSRDPQGRAYCRDHRSLWGTGLREVSTNGRDWVDYASLVDADSFEDYTHRRVDGEVVAGLPTFYPCTFDGKPCARPATFRHVPDGPSYLCDEHYLDREGKLTALAKFTTANTDARIRMRLMDLDVDRRRAPGRPHGAYPKTFGGIWRTR